MQNKKLIKKLAVILGIILGVILLANVALNVWLNNYLPGYIKNNSYYNVSYGQLDVDLITGSIVAENLKVASKNPNDQNVIGLDGSLDKVSISRLGIYEAIRHKRINSSSLNLNKPDLKITLAKPIDDRTGKKRNPIGFKNINVSKGNILILRHTKQKFVSVQDLDLSVSNLKMTEEQVESKLPVVFDEYNIRGKNFYYRPDNVYVLKAANITTENGQMTVQQFQLIPLLTFNQFTRYYPKKTSLLKFDTKEMKFTDIVLKKNRIALSEVKFDTPNVTMYTTSTKGKQAKPFNMEVELEDVQMQKAKIQIYKPNGKNLFAANTLNLDIDKLLMDEETVKSSIPFTYDKFLVEGTGLQFSTATQDVTASTAKIDKTLVLLRNVLVKPSVNKAASTLADLSAAVIQLKINEWKIENKKLKLDAESALVNGLKGNIYTVKRNASKPKGITGISYPLKVKNIQISGPGLTVNQAGNYQNFGNLNLRVQNLEINEQTAKNNIPFKTGNYSVTTSNYKSRISQFYNMSAGLLKMNNGNLQINNFALLPVVSRSQFIRMIPAERDLYTLRAANLNMKGSWDLLSEQKHIKAQNLTINNLDANIFRSKVPTDDKTIKPMYSDLLRSIKFPMVINDVLIKNSTLVYEEDTKASEGPGKLTFGNFNLNLKNLNSGRKATENTKIPIQIHCRFMNASPMHVRWNLDTASMNDAFTIAGNISDLPAPRINPFIEPYLKIRATGIIKDLIFNFRGSVSGLNGTVNMKHEKLKVELLKKETGEKNKVLSAVVNIFVKSNSGDYPESVTVDNVKRDPTKSFFNLFWNGIQEGLKKTLIGKNVENIEKSVKNTVKDAKDVSKTVKKEVKTVTEKVNTQPAEQSGEKKEGFFKRIFKKKDKQ